MTLAWDSIFQLPLCGSWQPKESEEFLWRMWPQLPRRGGLLRAYEENFLSVGVRTSEMKGPREVPHIYSQRSTLQFVQPALDNSFY